ncbi:MAG: hypothetical protein K2L14_00735 [Duncaniella sp.]|nr:hypothetical protein [Duncaniella sp.]
MRIIISLLLIFCSYAMQAKNLKVNRKEEIKSIKLNIENVEPTQSGSIVYVSLIQKKNFSYNISFSDIYLSIPNESIKIKGKVFEWDNDRKAVSDTKSISDKEKSSMSIWFPDITLSKDDTFDIKIGDLLDRNRTELIVTDVKAKK